MSEPFVLIGPKEGAQPFSHLAARRVISRAQVLDAFEGTGRQATWIAPRASVVPLLAALAGRPKGDPRLLLLQPAGGPRHGLLHAVFRFVVAPEEGATLLPAKEIAEILASPDRSDLFLGGTVDRADGVVVLYRGTLEPLIVPLDWFRARPGGPRPDPARFAMADYGQTVRLGEYEAAADAILYEFDPEYRRRARLRSIDEDRSFGGALRRVRLQRGLSRSDFPGISAKEIARLERGEVKRPHGDTLARLAKRLRVAPEEIATY